MGWRRGSSNSSSSSQIAAGAYHADCSSNAHTLTCSHHAISRLFRACFSAPMPLSFAGVAAEPASHAAIRSTGGLSAQSRTAMPPRNQQQLLLQQQRQLQQQQQRQQVLQQCVQQVAAVAVIQRQEFHKLQQQVHQHHQPQRP
ncbi:unnamed protein product [Closterium sp. NIES-53]